jgi:hypothetical protein
MAQANNDFTVSADQAKERDTREVVLSLLLFNSGFVFGFLISVYLQLMGGS